MGLWGRSDLLAVQAMRTISSAAFRLTCNMFEQKNILLQLYAELTHVGTMKLYQLESSSSVHETIQTVPLILGLISLIPY